MLPATCRAAASAQNKADDIIGNWFAEQDGIGSYVAITKSPDGTYQAQVYWVEDSTAPDGTKSSTRRTPTSRSAMSRSTR